MTRQPDTRSTDPDAPVPPARTRWVEPGTAEASAVPVPPVHSRGPAPRPPVSSRAPRAATPAEPQLAPDVAFGFSEYVGEIVVPERAAPAALAESSVPDRTGIDVGATERVTDVEIEPVPGLEVEPAVPEGLQAVQAPLSVWDLGLEPWSESREGGIDERAARARQEWEELGNAIAESVGLTEDDALRSTLQAMASEIESTDTADEESAVPREIVELADRIAYFASRLRAAGYSVVAEAQAAGDRLDAALAALAAGYLAARHE